MEGADPDGVVRVLQKGGNTLLHLLGSLVGKGDGEDARRVHPALLNQVSDAVRDHARLARTGACKYQKRTAFMLRGQLLNLI